MNTGTTAGIYNSASYGPLGKGAIHYYYRSNWTLDEKKTRWDNPRNSFAGKAGNHGLYSGAGSITDRDGNYDFSFQPIDWSDAIAKRHDMDYAAATATGEEYAGFLDDVRTLQADKDMLQRISDFTNPFKKVKGVEKPFRTSWSGEMQISIEGQAIVIGALATYKQWKIDSGYTSKDSYQKLQDEFRKYNSAMAILLDKLSSTDLD